MAAPMADVADAGAAAADEEEAEMKQSELVGHTALAAGWFGSDSPGRRSSTSSFCGTP